MQEVRPPAVAGSFYPGDPARLAAQVDRMMAGAVAAAGAAPKALIAPHAGYIYSGPIAATAYAQLAPVASRIRRVVLLGPSHYVPFRGLALPEAARLATPLGEIPVDPSVAAGLRGVVLLAVAHAREHSLEVQLPFLQLVLKEFTLVPLAVGRAEPEIVADVLEALWGGPETVIVISSDLSHYLPYDEARDVDRGTAARILSLGTVASDEACGSAPVNGLLALGRRRRLAVRQLDLRSSGDTAGDKDRVVGYGAFAFDEVAQ